jgi:hypothetical protein
MRPEDKMNNAIGKTRQAGEAFGDFLDQQNLKRAQDNLDRATKEVGRQVQSIVGQGGDMDSLERQADNLQEGTNRFQETGKRKRSRFIDRARELSDIAINKIKSMFS